MIRSFLISLFLWSTCSFSFGLTTLSAVIAAASASADQLDQETEILFADFDARPLSVSEKRIVQMALAIEGDYNGLIDGAWGRRSQRALEAFVTRTFEDMPRYIHVAALVAGFAEEFVDDGWIEFYEQQFGVTFLLPEGQMREEARTATSVGYESTRGMLSVRVERHTASDLVDLHEFGLNRYGPARGEVYELRERHRWVTSFRDRDGDYWYVRTEPVNGSLTSVRVIADPSNRNLLNAIATSILPGQANLLNPEVDGVLFSIIETAARAFEEEDRQSPGTSGSADEARGGSGSGVMISDLGHIVTNYHVVEGCRKLSANGAAVTVEKVSEDHDLALLAPVNGFSLLLGRPVASLAVDAAELNQDITVAGYPMGGALGGLNVTRGSVSSRQGPGGDEDLFQFTAAIQPGNSGGPILDATGQVVGLVVAKLDDQFFADASGVLPQDISFGISRSTVAEFIINVPGIESPGWFSASRAGRNLSNTELARHAEAVTYLIECE